MVKRQCNVWKGQTMALSQPVEERRKVYGCGWLRFLASSLLSSARVVRKWVSDRGNSLLSLFLSLPPCFNVNDLNPSYRIKASFPERYIMRCIYRLAKTPRGRIPSSLGKEI